MANEKVKTEMKGTTSRWCSREVAKRAANHARRVADKKKVQR